MDSEIKSSRLSTAVKNTLLNPDSYRSLKARKSSITVNFAFDLSPVKNISRFIHNNQKLRIPYKKAEVMLTSATDIHADGPNFIYP